MQKCFTILLLCSYALPALLGHGGLHAMFGVKHDSCCEQTSLSAEELVCLRGQVKNGHSHSCSACKHTQAEEKSQQSTAEDSKSSPAVPEIPVRHSEDNCSLCQHLAHGQLETQAVGLVTSSDCIVTNLVLEQSAVESRFYAPHAPRGPPAC
ncbi:hypothetical protein [uncultured Rubinisphaera sp.]|uniref:hypothetical protein n=1 Tax=uncultured Rubinisphaera sp. TaxID=1678686 RepID=UPI0030D8E313